MRLGSTGGPTPHGMSRAGLGVFLGALVAVALLLLSSVAVPSGAASASSGVTASSTKGGCGYLKLPTPICHVFVLYLENQNANYVLNHAPFQRYLAHTYAYASEYYSVEHYSFPNYLASTSGTVNNYLHLLNKRNLVDLIRNQTPTATWAAYLEDMPQSCDWNSTANYKAAHNAFVWYSDIRSNASRCRAHDLNFTGWDQALQNGSIPNYAFFGPNATHACWVKGTLKLCDAWLKGWLSPLINDSFFNRSVFFITYDEGAVNNTLGVNGTAGGGRVYMTAVSPYACKGFQSTYNYSHYDLLTTTEWLLNLSGRTGYNDSWSQHPPMRDLFCFPSGSVAAPSALLHPAASPNASAAVPVILPRRPPLGVL